MRHSKDFKNIQEEFSNSISDIITEKQADAILSGLNIPDAPKGNYLVGAQLKLIKRLILAAE